MSRKTHSAALAAAALACAFSAPAEGHPPGDGVRGAEVPPRVERALGGEVQALENGLYRLRSDDGFALTTHGPDPRPDFLAVEDHGSALDLADPQRPPACATDYYQEVLYGYPVGSTNALASKKSDIQAMVGVMNALLNEESLASGGPTADYKVGCESDGTIRVSAFAVNPNVELPADGRASFSEVVSSAKAAGFGDGTSDRNVDHTIFYDGLGPSGVCGTGSMWGDESPGAGNRNNNPGGSIQGGYGVSYPGCWFGRTPMHENAHNQGAVQYSAPDSTGDGAHCNEANDVLCYLDGGSLLQNYPQACETAPGVIHFDCAWDTYFDSSPEPGEYLATSWNLGSPVNRFVRFGADARMPDTAITAGPAALSAERNPVFAFTSTELGSFQCSLDSAPFVACGSGQAYAGLGDGPHSFQVRALDPSLNADPTPAIHDFAIDATGPLTQIDAGPSRVRLGKNARFSFSAPEPATFECGLDDAAYTPCSSPYTVRRPKRGSHTFAVRGTDSLGNFGAAPAERSFKVKRKRRGP